ncbi:nitrous oxide reductase accessory protein NosL [Curvibacter sp. APW13]|uniref:nitrous oxide reductase accessory protein NosL n=1 Tax=Curvibacter sp. APW13 TaxID=3077236 RepID=UPI0028DE389F|nr:nitrous oxide reductase accessory protein NosL [Curvibacter sp. APW13]MDT8990746.1 nitrous oxide reductase accessory protein NosL [Curvibacter sp. APW13]
MASPVLAPPPARWLLLALLMAATLLAGWGGWKHYRARMADAALEDGYCVVAPPTRFDPAWGVGLLEPRPIPADARCPVCGMFPARKPEWAAQLIFANGDTQFFDSPLTLLVYLHDVGRFAPGRSAAEVQSVWVTDGGTRRWIDAKAAFYVHGSDALGPMRAGNLPPFATEVAAQAFAQRRGGQVLRADALTPTLLDRMIQPHRHAQMGVGPGA